MDGLNDDERYALSQLRELTNGGDDEAAINILESVGWNVQVGLKKPCVDLFNLDSSSPSALFITHSKLPI